MNKPLLICTDLDRTLLPNGEQAESPQARQLFSRIAMRDDVRLAYVSGRHLQLVEQAIIDYQLPQPNYIIGDVGTSIYHRHNNTWQLWQAWLDEIAPCWNGYQHDRLAQLFCDIDCLQLQPVQKQNQYKLSYYVPLTSDAETLVAEMRLRCQKYAIRASIIWSIDEPNAIGLIDVLPETATKLHAIEYLINQMGLSRQYSLFAGDSGNDLAVLTSPLKSVLVANASESVKQQASELSQENKTASNLYIAAGNFMGMNGNYSAGILEGMAYYFPDTIHWLERE